jgi:hypothetical protein
MSDEQFAEPFNELQTRGDRGKLKQLVWALMQGVKRRRIGRGAYPHTEKGRRAMQSAGIERAGMVICHRRPSGTVLRGRVFVSAAVNLLLVSVSTIVMKPEHFAGGCATPAIPGEASWMTWSGWKGASRSLGVSWLQRVTKAQKLPLPKKSATIPFESSNRFVARSGLTPHALPGTALGQHAGTLRDSGQTTR